METFSNDDIASGVLSRLPAKTLVSCKCVSKTWNSLISHPSVLRAHFERSQDLSGIFFQHYSDNWDHLNPAIAFVTLDKKQPQRLTNFLDFLPEKVVLMGSCNGLLCCRSRINPDPLYRTRDSVKELVIYICNPHSKEWITLRPKRMEVKDAFGFTFYPFGSSSNLDDPCIKLVSIHSPKDNSNVYSFLVYTSETGRWTPSKDVCHCNFKIRKNKMIFVGSRFHWLTWGHHIITFDIEKELSAVIKLPGPVMRKPGWGICLGGSRGCLHYVCAHASEVRVWMLKDYGKSEWSLKCNLNLSEFFMEHKKHFADFLLNEFNKLEKRLFSYDFRTTELKERCRLFAKERYITTTPTVVPYTVCVAAAGVLKEGQHLGHKKNGQDQSVDSSSGPKQKRRKHN